MKLKLQDFIHNNINLESDVDTNIVTTPVPIEDVKVEPVLSRKQGFLGSYVSKITEADNVVQKEVTVIEPIERTSYIYHTATLNTDAKQNFKTLEENLNNIEVIVAQMLDIVREYQHTPEDINESKVQEFKQKLTLLNALFGKDYNISTEDSLEGYVEMMTKVLTNVAEDIDNLKSELATMIHKVGTEVQELNVNKHKEIVKSVSEKLKSKSIKMVSLVDHLLEAVHEMKDLNRDVIIDHIQHHEYLISGADDATRTLGESPIGDTGLRDDKIKNIADALIVYINICKQNSVLTSTLISEDIEDITNRLTGFTINILPKLNNVYKDVLESVSKENTTIESLDADSKLDKMKSDVNTFLIKAIEDLNKDKVIFHHDTGYYAIENDALIKKNWESLKFVPKMDKDIFTLINNVLQSVTIPNETLVQLPNALISLLKSKALEVDDTKQLYNINIALGVTLGLTQLFRDQVVYGVHTLFKGIADLSNAYLNLINVLDGTGAKDETK